MKKLFASLLVLVMLCSAVGSLAEWNGTITVVQSNDVIAWDPIASTDTSTKNIMKNMVNRLFETDDMFNPLPIMVKEYEMVDDLNWKFTIHDNITFFNGEICTVEDVIYCLWRSKNESSSGKTLLKPIVEMTPVDDFTFVITTDSTYPSLLTALSNSSTSVFSQKVLEGVKAGTVTWDEVMTTGATGRYILGERVIGDHCTLIKNEDYWNKDDMAKNDKLIFKVVPEATTRTIMVQTGEADVNVAFDTATYEDVKDDPNVVINSHVSTTTYYIAPNCVKGPFSDVRVRQAANYAINREDCLTVGSEGHGNITYSIFPSICYGYTDNPAGFEWNVEKAQQLLAEAGYPNGFDCKGIVKSDAEERIAQVVQAYLQMIGINMSITRIDNTVLVETCKAGDFDLAFDYSAFYQDPALFLDRQFTAEGIGAKNLSHYDNEKVNELRDLAAGTFVQEERDVYYEQLHEILCTECAWIPLYVGTMYNIVRTGVQDALLNVETTYDFYRIYYGD